MGLEPPATKIYGERNTGTNYLAALVEQNLETLLIPGTMPKGAMSRRADARWQTRLGRSHWQRFVQRRVNRYFEQQFAQTLGWKHSLPSVDALRAVAAPDTRFLTLTKNPYSWLLSLHRRPYQFVPVPEAFEDFVTMPWHPLPRDRMDGPVASPVELWNRKNAAYLELGKAFRCANVVYEELVADPTAGVAAIAAALELGRRRGDVVNVEESTKGDDQSFASYRDHYVNERWRAELSADAVRRVNERLDRGVCERFGYEILDPAAV